MGFRISEHVWVAPFVGVAWVQGEDACPPYVAADGFRLLIGGELQLHSAVADENFDLFGGLGLAFERLVAHGRAESCGHCTPTSQSLIGNGANLELRVGVLVRFAKFLRIGPYLGTQLSVMPGLKLNEYVYPDYYYGPGGSQVRDVGNVQLWLDLGLRVVFLL